MTTRRVVRAMALTVTMTALAAGSAGAQQEPAYDQPYRPQFHFSPAKNWMNDPNGLVHYKGEYHLFFQHNPFGDTWGHMSWGHAVSRDLVHWEELPLAIPEEGDEAIFSGSAVVDHGNTSGLGTRENPPMVAVYTSATPGDQAQSLAYSTDRGRTWRKYAGNPVLDDPDREFRDPKVFWYEPERKWVMVAVKALQHKVAIYESRDLEHWEHLSDFGPANAVGGAWECPDLFPLPVDGKRNRTKWVMLVSLNPGGVAGGSGTQYFVGDFDGTRFTSEDAAPYTPPAGDVFADFEGGDYGPWTATGTAFGSGPATGTLPGQQVVSGFQGQRLVNSFIDFDSSQGTLTSPSFRIARDYINLLIGGGAHAHDPAEPSSDETAVNLLVDGEVVRSASGKESEALDWTSWDVRELEGREARIQIVDRNSGGWGHVLADQITFADAPAISVEQRSRWVDFGKDDYAGVTYNDAPGGRRVLIGWMNNWQYATQIPTSPWRSAMTVPRELALRTTEGRPALVQRPVRELDRLRGGRGFRARDVRVPDGTWTPPGRAARGQTLEIEAVLDPGSAATAGLKVRVGDGEETVIGYDARSQQLFVDRTRSGDVSFNPQFPGVQRAPLATRDGRIPLRVLVDRSSVEVFAGRGRVAITDQVFPRASSDGVQLFADGGTATVERLSIRPLRSAWTR